MITKFGSIISKWTSELVRHTQGILLVELVDL